jgi:hypothetical protein
MVAQYLTHDGAESRLNYENSEIEELPSSVVISEIDDEVDYQNVGHGFRDRFSFIAEVMGETKSYELQVSVPDYGDSESLIRGSYLEDDSQVFFGTIVSSAEELVKGKDDLKGQILERRF